MTAIGNDHDDTPWSNYAGEYKTLWASEWYRQFDGTPDHRNELTWRDRLVNVGATAGPEVYNFYSRTEEVLREYPGNSYVEGFGTYAWVKQEKLKGTEYWLGGVGGVKPTVFYGAPTGFAGMLAHPALPAANDVALRLVSSAGEALPAEIGERFKRHFGVDIVDGIGSTEMLHIFLSNRPERVRYGSTGWPVAGYQIELRGEGGESVPDGELGDLYIHGPSAAMMYWGNRQKTRETFQGGWTKSGDKYVRNTDGSYTYSGRSDDMLKVSGIYVSPFEVEATLVQHPAVLEAAVIGVPDAEGLTKTKAFVVRKAGATVTEDELKLFVKERLAPYKYPRQIAFVDDLPKTATGKIQRFKLREQEAGSA